jgi:aldose 1-epimerase
MADLILRADGLEAGLKPEIGGAFTHFADLSGAGSVDLFHPSQPGFDDVLNSSGFALVPFCNRVRDGRFTFDGRDVQLKPNMPGEKHPLHGQGWRNAWTVAETGPAFAQLVYRHAPGDWPWAYEARLTVALRLRGLEVILTCVNRSDSVMPCGLGLHPYYPCDAHTVLDTGALRVWTVDEEIMPVEAIPVQGRYALSERRVCGQGLDNGYDGWTGQATIAWPDRGRALRLTSRAPRFQLYSPKEGGRIAAEPVTNAICALNQPQAEWPKLGLWRLEPGETARLSARFAVLDI